MFVTAGVLKHAQTRGHGRERGAAAHDVFTEGHVHMCDGEDNQHVHQCMVHRTHGLSIAKEREHPSEPGHPARVGTPGLSIKRKTRDDEEDAAQHEEAEHGELRERIVTRVLCARLLHEEVIGNLTENPLPPLPRPKRRNEDLTRVLVPDDRPVETVDEKHRVDDAGRKMRKADVGEVIGSPCIAEIGNQRRPNEEPGHNHHEHADHHGPVPHGASQT